MPNGTHGGVSRARRTNTVIKDSLKEYLYLSAGVSAQLFQETLAFAYQAGANFNGVLCGRSTWAGVVSVCVEKGEEAAREWLRTEGRANLEALNESLASSVISIFQKVQVIYD
ncbi:hypothetical protein [Streptococcus sp. 121]|uniref:hypothetical protein n=1 Tax=Streptococcus sp. 121 TaxID=2797637 RepID=UPI002D7EF698|nr:hypothetical protein [Streptococcus sp. 121]